MRRKDVPDDLVLFPEDETAGLLKNSPKTLGRWRAQGVGPRWVRVGRKPMYRLSDLLAWFESNSVNSTSEET